MDLLASAPRRVLGLFDPRGRLSRPAYHRLFIRLGTAQLAFLCVAVWLAAAELRPLAFAAAAVIILLVVANFALLVRRLHDRGRTGWWFGANLASWALTYTVGPAYASRYAVALAVLVLFDFCFALWFVIETFCRSGTAGPNRFGADPRTAPEG
jgi:uncharacterized membrane protein YhaH (DUF805 family)